MIEHQDTSTYNNFLISSYSVCISGTLYENVSPEIMIRVTISGVDGGGGGGLEGGRGAWMV